MNHKQIQAQKKKQKTIKLEESVTQFRTYIIPLSGKKRLTTFKLPEKSKEELHQMMVETSVNTQSEIIREALQEFLEKDLSMIKSKELGEGWRVKFEKERKEDG